jgi:hypothetical protein
MPRMVNSSLNNNLFAWNDQTAGSRDSGSEQSVGLFNPLGKIERGLKIIGINEILLAMWSAGALRFLTSIFASPAKNAPEGQLLPTYESFLDVVGELERAGYTRLKVVRSVNAERFFNEFHVLLG